MYVVGLSHSFASADADRREYLPTESERCAEWAESRVGHGTSYLMTQARSLRSSRRIFIIEGLVTIVVALISYFFIPASLNKASFLTESDKEELSALLKKDSDAADSEAFNWRGVKAALTDPQCWGYAALFHCHSFSLYSITLFSPTIIRNLGYATWRAQLLTTPPYAAAFIVVMASAYASYKAKRRAPFIIGFDVLIIIGTWCCEKNVLRLTSSI